MARSLSIAVYLASLGSSDRAARLTDQPPRPPGVVIWARCSDPEQLTAIETLHRKLTEDGDPVRVIATLRDWTESLSARALAEPKGKANIRAFISHWRPTMVIWVRGDLAPLLLAEIRTAQVPSMLVDATVDGLEQMTGSWVPGAMRSLLSQFDPVLTIDQNAAERLIRAGARPGIVRVSGAMEDCAPPLPCSDAERRELAQSIGTRPVWLAVSADLHEWSELCAAHVLASRRAHRLLLIVVPRDSADAAIFATNLRSAGLHVTLRSQEPEPAEPTQVYVIDTDEELGLWYRIAPTTYLGGTLHGAATRDPFEAAALGSAVLYGPQVAPFQKHAARLNAAGASRLIRSATDLGPAVETLLAVDKAAILAHAAWDVTSRGADVTNRIVGIIQRRLAELGH
ncbi:glycosyltransferase N-terminal domain-containing protein [Yoonia sp.]|uniref:3-deoxy-D-manno-octulosonic acid transferase n=1 Tax=Yoonia sp. TaxID=2212373 RepID=UPI0025E931AD|nr:glycosyltransferase N-terminal domain-containing protein [Yoonia sp.]